MKRRKPRLYWACREIDTNRETLHLGKLEIAVLFLNGDYCTGHMNKLYGIDMPGSVVRGGEAHCRQVLVKWAKRALADMGLEGLVLTMFDAQEQGPRLKRRRGLDL